MTDSFDEILLLGGSNAAMNDGWAHFFVRKAQDHGWRVENAFLGAVGSLYAVLALQRRIREGAPAPSWVVCEYMLNDLLLANARIISVDLIRDAIEEVATLCAAIGSRIVFLCLEPRYARAPGRIGPTARVRAAYRAVAESRGISCLFASGALGAPAMPTDYIDDNHYGPAASQRISEALFDFIKTSAGCSRPSPPFEHATLFEYQDARDAEYDGEASLTTLSSRVYSGASLEMRRPSRVRFAGRGRLAGLLICADSESGWYTVSAGAWARRKNAATSVLDLLPNFVTLHYFADMPRTVAVEIGMSEHEETLERLRPDNTLLERTPRTPFQEQKLRILGVVFWVGARGWLGVRETIELKGRTFWRWRRRRRDGSTA